MKKIKYKEVPRKNQWVVIANYQPANMWMRPEDTKISRYKTVEEAMDAIEGHKKQGACDIEVFQVCVHLWFWCRIGGTIPMRTPLIEVKLPKNCPAEDVI